MEGALLNTVTTGFRCLVQGASLGIGAVAPGVSVAGVGNWLSRALFGIPGTEKLGWVPLARPLCRLGAEAETPAALLGSYGT